MNTLSVGIADSWNEYHIREYTAALAAQPGVQLIRGLEPELLRDPNVQALIYAPRPGGCYASLRRALECGKHVFCDKFVSLSSREISDLQSLAAAGGLQLMLELPFLSRPLYSVLETVLSSPALGQIHSVHIRNAHSGLTDGTLPEKFLQDPHGVLYDIGAHPIYLALSLFGIPDTVSCHLQRTVSGSVHTYHALLGTPDLGILCESSYCAEEGGFFVDLMGSKGSFHLQTHGPELQFNFYPDLKEPVQLSSAPSMDTPVQQWCHVITTGLPNPCPFGLAASASELITRLYGQGSESFTYESDFPKVMPGK